MALAGHKRKASSCCGDPNPQQQPRKKAQRITNKRCCALCRADNCIVVAPEGRESFGCTELDIAAPGLNIINGKSQSGKSFLERYMVYMKRNEIGHAIVFSNSGMNGNNLDYIHPDFKHHMYGEKLPRKDGETYPKANYPGETVGRRYLGRFLEEQLRIPYNVRPLGLVIVDDDMSGFNDSVLIRAATQTFHYKIMMIICTQHVNMLHGAIRGQAHRVAMHRIETKLDLQGAYESYGQDFYDFNTFKEVMLDDENTGQHRFLWKNKMGDEPWRRFRCPGAIPPFRVGPWPDE